MGRPRIDPSKPSAKARIQAAAEEAFSEWGVHGASQREIARLAGVNVNLVSYYYPDKVDLFSDIVALRTEELRARADLLLADLLARHPPESVPVPEIFGALLRLPAQLEDSERAAWPRFIQMIGKEYGSDHWRSALAALTDAMVGPVDEALGRSLPTLDTADRFFLVTLAHHCAAFLADEWNRRFERTEGQSDLPGVEVQLAKALTAAAAAFI